jgi:hypothetical protein
MAMDRQFTGAEIVNSPYAKARDLKTPSSPNGLVTMMNETLAPPASMSAPRPGMVGRVTSVSGAGAILGLTPSAPNSERLTVGKFTGIVGDGVVTVGLISEIDEDDSGLLPGAERERRAVAKLDLIGEITANGAGGIHFQRGLKQYPKIGDGAVLIGERELRLIYGTASSDHAHIGELQQNTSIGVHVNIDDLVRRHFAVLGTTGVGKSSGVAIILQEILSARPNLRIFMLDPHNEYTNCYGDKAEIFTPQNLRLPFWLFNFEEAVDAFFGGRPGLDEEVEILSEAIPLAKLAYLQYRPADRQLAKKRDVKSAGFTGDTPVPYRIEDLISVLDERMGKLENRASRMLYHKLITRIQTFQNNPRYSFMFENANIGGDTMVDILSKLFRLPPNGQPMTILQLAGLPAEVIDAVVSVICRMAFDFGIWSDGAAPMLLICEEAHRYAPADSKLGFGPTRRALSRIAKEGRKYGVYLGLVTQRPSEIDPAIISQCNTLFVMRLSNERDQAFLRSAVPDASKNQLSFIPSLGTREVFVSGLGIQVPSYVRFKELPVAMRPSNNEAVDTRSDGSAKMSRDLIASVVERWRNASLNHRTEYESKPVEFASPQATSAPPPPPTVSARPVSPAIDALRGGVLKRPLDDRLATAAPPAPFARPRSP